MKTLQKWKLSTWGKNRQSNETVLTQGAECRGKDGISSSNIPGRLGHLNSSMRLVGAAQLPWDVSEFEQVPLTIWGEGWVSEESQPQRLPLSVQ